MLARVHTHQGCLLCPMGSPAAPAAVKIVASVGRNGTNLRNDVATVQAALNKLPPQFGGPSPKLAVDGDAWAKTRAAIDAFQAKHFGWNDGLIAPAGPTLAKLAEFSNAFGLEAAPAPPAPDQEYEERLRFRLARARAAMPFLKKAAIDAVATIQAAISYVDNGYLADINNLARRKGYELADKYFDFAGQTATQTQAELKFIANMCRRVASAVAMRLLLTNFHRIWPGPTLFVIDRNKLPYIAYSPRRTDPATPNANANFIYLCDRIDAEGPDRYQRILCHELFHFVDDETAAHQIIDHGYNLDAMLLPHVQRMHNADNYALFTLHASTGRTPLL